jgi:hypothetical protein
MSAHIVKLIDKADEALERLRDALQEHFDDKSERWQEGEAGDEWQQKIDAAEQALDALGECRP